MLEELNNDLARTVDAAERGLVHIQSGSGFGSGTIVHSEGLIVTNAHVVGGGVKQIALPDGTRVEARVVAYDRYHDLAALSATATGLAPIAIGDSEELKSGQFVFAIGNPWGVPGAVTAGAYIGKRRELRRDDAPEREWLAASLHVRPGHSGGPLVDAAGRLIGINTMMAGPDVGLAVPVSAVKRFLREAFGA
jgi:S1-C subfamily serine protease